MKPLRTAFAGEFLGTFLLVFFGCGSVAAAITLGAQVGVFQVAIVWGIGIALAIHCTAALSGAHLNPAVTVAAAVWQGFPKGRMLPYMVAQMLGALVAAAVLHAMFAEAISAYETAQGITRGAAGSEASAMIYGEYFPNPGGKPLAQAGMSLSLWRACLIEIIGTAVLVLIIFTVTDRRNPDAPQLLTAGYIGLTVTLLISLIGPLTMACFNPARDLGPRLFSSLAGWGTVPFTANGALGWWVVYLISPLVGGWLGGAVHRSCVAR
ncbi:MAG: MIP family channel protein, partial [Verrucomicrobiales bacterium]|nr:MIP family channel protein [Verrucomicrobiales bacterium]